MSTRRIVGVVVLVATVLGSACGGDGNDSGGEVELEEVELEATPIVSVDPCSLLTRDDAARLVGTEVEPSTGSALGRAVGCAYAPSGEATARALAELRIEPRDEATTAEALAAVTAEAEEEAVAGEEVEPVDVGDGGVVVRSDDKVVVRYVVRNVLVTLAVSPEAEVDEELKSEVIELATETVEPVKTAVDEAPFDGPGTAVPATTSIYLAEIAAEDAADGTDPPRFDLDDLEIGDELRFDVTGSVHCCAGIPNGTADGEPAASSIIGINGIGGFAADRQLPLLGLFLDDDSPDAEPEPGETQSGGASRAEPELGVPFLIGDGLDDDGEPLVVEVPDGATRLYLGFADAFTFSGATGFYDDNTGAVRVTLVT